MTIEVYKKVRHGSKKGKSKAKMLKVKEIYSIEKCSKTGQIERKTADFSTVSPLIIECLDASGVVYALQDKTGSIAEAIKSGVDAILNVNLSLSKHFLSRSEAIRQIRVFPLIMPLIFN